MTGNARPYLGRGRLRRVRGLVGGDDRRAELVLDALKRFGDFLAKKVRLGVDQWGSGGKGVAE
ncbi:hypothetical protein [Herbidospora yilanensis]|uniref:hypothetical protein n=1 Tax=Herbidospora yilanensis TaxID=354426 RepID=UPI000785560D|nr:hypothetical protein [Herbidospora yilanensis]